LQKSAQNCRGYLAANAGAARLLLLAPSERTLQRFDTDGRHATSTLLMLTQHTRQQQAAIVLAAWRGGAGAGNGCSCELELSSKIGTILRISIEGLREPTREPAD
jgi:hypothetical protein